MVPGSRSISVHQTDFGIYVLPWDHIHTYIHTFKDGRTEPLGTINY